MKNILKGIALLILFVCAAALISCTDDTQTPPDTACKHTDMSTHTYEPDCDTEGYTLNTCISCGMSYKTDILPPNGHNYTTKQIPPTCSYYGYTTYTCGCGFTYSADYVNKLSHTFTKTTTLPTCNTHGCTEYTCEKCGFSYLSDYVKPNGHTLEQNTVAPTCTQQGYTEYKCADCEYSFTSDILPPTGHTIEQTHTETPTCTETGETQYSCACGYTYTVTVPATGHDFTSAVTLPTLSDMGYTLHTCNTCAYEYKGEYTFYSDILPNGAYADGSDVLARGIDISYHQYKKDESGTYIPLDFAKIKASGIDYVIIRICDPRIGIDPTFEMSYNGAKEAGLHVGAYIFSRAVTVREAQLEAQLVTSAIGGKKFEYPIYLDLEDTDENIAACPRPEEYTEICMEFFSNLQSNGYYTGLYLNNTWLSEKVQTETVLQKFDVWYARYPAEPTAEPAWDIEKYGAHLGMWQYSDSGSVDGIEGNVDMLLCYKDYPRIISEYKLNGYNDTSDTVNTVSPYVWITVSGQIKVRSKSDFYIIDDYDSTLDVIGFANYGERYEVLEITDTYLKILYNGEQAYISSLPKYVSLRGMY